MPMAVMLYSAVVHLDQSRGVDVFVVDGGLAPATRRRIENVVHHGHAYAQVNWMIPPTDNSGPLPIKSWISTAAYLRLHLPDLIPSNFDRVLYLDSDMLIQDDLGLLWDEFLSDLNPVAAAQDYKIPLVSSEGGLKNYRDLRLLPEKPYFNSGLLLMDLRQWRTEQVAQRVLDYTACHAEFIQWADQDGLNAILADKWSRIDPRWNISSHLYYDEVTPEGKNYEYLMLNRDALIEKPGIIHYTGPLKPWNYRTEHPAKSEWVRYLMRSGWYSDTEFMLWLLNHNIKKRAYSFYKRTIAPIRYKND